MDFDGTMALIFMPKSQKPTELESKKARISRGLWNVLYAQNPKMWITPQNP